MSPGKAAQELGWAGGRCQWSWGVPGGGTGVLLAVPRAWVVGLGPACILGGCGIGAVVWALSVAARTRGPPPPSPGIAEGQLVPPGRKEGGKYPFFLNFFYS